MDYLVGYLQIYGRGLRRACLILLSPPSSCNHHTLCQNQWHVVGKVS